MVRLVRVVRVRVESRAVGLVHGTHGFGAVGCLGGLGGSEDGPPVRELTTKYDHHLLINVGDFGGGEEKRFRERLSAFEATHPISVHTCTKDETPWVSYFRFAAAPAVTATSPTELSVPSCGTLEVSLPLSSSS